MIIIKFYTGNENPRTLIHKTVPLSFNFEGAIIKIMYSTPKFSGHSWQASFIPSSKMNQVLHGYQKMVTITTTNPK